jgi:phosphohistidine phosphatase SixA
MRIHPVVALLVAVCAASLPAAVGAQAPAGTAASGFAVVVATADTVVALRAGGFALYLRHGATANARPDRVPAVDLADCSTQRPLSDEGRSTAARVGAALRDAGIPTGEIHVSPMCRTRDTATAAFPGRSVVEDDRLVYTANLTDAQKAPILERTRALLSAPVPAGTNRLLIAHAPNLMDLIGYFPTETTLVVFRPRGEGQFDYVASIPADLWPSLPGGR